LIVDWIDNPLLWFIFMRSQFRLSYRQNDKGALSDKNRSLAIGLIIFSDGMPKTENNNLI
jgi:hypothetical protein